MAQAVTTTTIHDRRRRYDNHDEGDRDDRDDSHNDGKKKRKVKYQLTDLTTNIHLQVLHDWV